MGEENKITQARLDALEIKLKGFLKSEKGTLEEIEDVINRMKKIKNKAKRIEMLRNEIIEGFKNLELKMEEISKQKGGDL